MSALSERLAAGQFTITAELSPARGASSAAMETRAGLLRGWVDAVNLTDNQGAHVRMASWAAAIAAKKAGLEPVMQMTCRDRNRIALQSDLLGAVSVGIENFMFMSGDHPKFGDHPGAKPVFDLDSIQLAWAARTLRDEGRLLSGVAVKPPPEGIFIGAVENPFAEPREFRVQRAGKKIAAGAQFIQTQYVFDVGVFTAWVSKLGDLGLLDGCSVLAGVGVIRSARMLEFLASGKVPGVALPEPVVRRLSAVPADQVGAEGAALAAEIIAELKDVPGVAGIHLLTAGYEKQTPALLERAGVAAGRGPLPAAASTAAAGTASGQARDGH